jgi:hypothetical protein
MLNDFADLLVDIVPRIVAWPASQDCDDVAKLIQDRGWGSDTKLNQK